MPINQNFCFGILASVRVIPWNLVQRFSWLVVVLL
jgi:hypothetical protein